MIGLLGAIGRRTVDGVAEFGLAAAILAEGVFWLLAGRFRGQPVRPSAMVQQMMHIGVLAVPIVAMLAGTVGVMLAIQGIYTLRTFGAESQVTIGVVLSVVREFGPLITGIIVAGRSGSALAARLGTMRINQELDALLVMGISPARFLAAPALIAALVVVPSLTVWANAVAVGAAGLYISAELGISYLAFANEAIAVIGLNDVFHGLGKSVIFAVLIVLVGVVNGASVSGGAEGVGRMTTRAVVHAISAIVLTDMLFAFIVTRG